MSIKLDWQNEEINQFWLNIFSKQSIDYEWITDPYEYETMNQFIKACTKKSKGKKSPWKVGKGGKKKSGKPMAKKPKVSKPKKSWLKNA